MTAEDLIAFENRVRAKWEAGQLPCLMHLCGGNEPHLKAIFTGINPGDWVFSTHRNHYHALLHGIPPADLEVMIDQGRSMFVYSAARRFFTSAILASCTGIAAGVAFDIKQQGGKEHVWCFLGDGAEEEGHFYEAAIFAEAHCLPLTFIIEDNNRQVDTTKAERLPGRPIGLDKYFRCVHRYYYTPTYPHAGSGCSFKIEFKPEAIQRLQSQTV